MIKTCYKLLISGQVQRVFFRDYTQKQAKSLGLTGWVKNLADGRVKVLLQGPKDKIKLMIDWCWQGSPLSRVDNIEVKQIKLKKLNSFVVKSN